MSQDYQSPQSEQTLCTSLCPEYHTTIKAGRSTIVYCSAVENDKSDKTREDHACLHPEILNLHLSHAPTSLDQTIKDITQAQDAWGTKPKRRGTSPKCPHQ
jgi:hypothetical protein